MNSKKWFGQAIEILVLGLIIYCVTLVIWRIQPLPENSQFKIIHNALPTFITSIGCLPVIKILKGMGYLWPATIAKIILRLDQNLSILSFIFAVIVALSVAEFHSVIYLFYSSIIKEPEQFLYPTLASLAAMLLFIPFFIGSSVFSMLNL